MLPPTALHLGVEITLAALTGSITAYLFKTHGKHFAALLLLQLLLIRTLSSQNILTIQWERITKHSTEHLTILDLPPNALLAIPTTLTVGIAFTLGFFHIYRQ